MSINFRTILIDGATDVPALIHVGTGVIEGIPEPPIGLPVTESLRGLFSTFKSVNRTSAGTTTAVTPISGGSLVLVDMWLSGDRVANSSVKVQFTDGSNTVIIFSASTVDDSVRIAGTFVGRVQGWKDAKVDLVTTGNVDATLFVTYLKLRDSLPFAEWDSFR